MAGKTSRSERAGDVGKRDSSAARGLSGDTSKTDTVARMHSVLGNRGMQRLLGASSRVRDAAGSWEQGARAGIHNTAADRGPGADRCEAEAERIAKDLSQIGLPRDSTIFDDPAESAPGPPRHLVSTPTFGAEEQWPTEVTAVLESPGRPLADEIRAFAERQLGADFEHVRVHTDAAAAASAHAVDAYAYTRGDHIAFGTGRYAPETREGLHLLVHELVHVVQQRRLGDSGRLPLQKQSYPGARASDGAASQELQALDDSIDRNPAWIYPGGRGSDANLRRILRCQESSGECDAADMTLIHHPWFRFWYLHGTRWLRSLPQAEREQAVRFLVTLNTHSGREEAAVAVFVLEIHSALFAGSRRSMPASSIDIGGPGRRLVTTRTSSMATVAERPSVANGESGSGVPARSRARAADGARLQSPRSESASSSTSSGSPRARPRLAVLRGGRTSDPPPPIRPEAPANDVPRELPFPAAVGSGISSSGAGVTGGRRVGPLPPAAVGSGLSPTQRGAYWRSIDLGMSTQPFPTARNSAVPRRTRGRGRGGVWRYRTLLREQLNDLRRKWFQEMRDRRAKRGEVEGRMLSAGIQPTAPHWRAELETFPR